MTQDKGFRERVFEIVRDYGRQTSDGGFKSAEFMLLDQATDRIVSLVRELVPDDVDDGSDTDRLIGFNRCRTEILSRLEDGK